ncbi:MAG: ribonucleoprotein [Planctomyces sp.]|nr:ribonucleoprotein [Planctomyces sp.]
MANKSLFNSVRHRLGRASVRNEAGGSAYQLSPRHQLAQLAATGCFNNTFYADARAQLDTLRKLVDQVDDNVFLAKLAVYARERAFMKDMPAALVVLLSTRDPRLLHRVFNRVVDNGRVLRTLFQMVRSGQFGRTSLSSSLQRAFQRWLNQASVDRLLSASIGNDPQLRDVLRLARPTPPDNSRRALYGWLTHKDVEKWAPAAPADLPLEVRSLDRFRTATSPQTQVEIVRDLSVRWDLLADAAQGVSVWKAIARQMGPQALRMNLNTLKRQGVLDDPEMVEYIAQRLQDRKEIIRARQFPYQYLSAYLNIDPEMPYQISRALHEAAEIACGNVPVLSGPVVIGLDTSGSMNSPVTGYRGHGGTTRMRCVDVAALFAAAVLRRNPDSVVIPFDTRAYHANVDPGDTILSLSQRLSQFGGGGTNCALPLQDVNTRLRDRKFAGCVLISDNESWIGHGRWGSTGVMTEWETFVKNQYRMRGHNIASPKLVCIDIQPYGTTQAPERADILNIGGFSDAVFQVVSSFLSGDASGFVREVESVVL